ncbi:MAG: tripartite tricarboxylate transporter substrate binding protein [Alphaproteobacteria bacterium]|nr:tripartite tricarboxylate transporter substrate binding protein [Alphaproteobacteria bacterium]
MIGRRALLAGAAGLAAPRAARAGGSATKLVLIVGARSGSKSDQVARAFAPFLERHLPRTVIEIRNVPGEAGLTAYRALAEIAPSGAILGWAGTPALPARIVDHADDGLLARLRLIGAVQKEPIAFVSPATSPISTARELIERSAAERDAVPLGTPPAGSPPHLAALRLQAVAGTKLNLVAFPSSAAARQAVLAGNVAAASLGLGDTIGGLRDGKLIGLGLASKARAKALPDLPSLHDIGLPVSMTIRRGLAAPAGLARGAEDGFVAAMRAVVADPEFAAQADQSGFVVDWLDGPDWTALARQEQNGLTALWASDPWLPTGAG